MGGRALHVSNHAAQSKRLPIKSRRWQPLHEEARRTHLLLHAVLDFFFQFEHFDVVMGQLLLPDRMLPEREMNTRHRLRGEG